MPTLEGVEHSAAAGVGWCQESERKQGEIPLSLSPMLVSLYLKEKKKRKHTQNVVMYKI